MLGLRFSNGKTSGRKGAAKATEVSSESSPAAAEGGAKT
jgi:hypothetical protein